MKQGTPQLTISIMHGAARNWKENDSRMKPEFQQSDEYASTDGW
jgi:hypothetical protein